MVTGAQTIGTLVSWGIASNHRSIGSVQGIVVGWSENKSYEKADCRNEVGSRIGEVVYDVGYSVRATVQVKHGTELPAPATTITVGGRVYRFVSGEVSESNQDYTKLSMNLEASFYNFTPTTAEGIS